MKVGILGLGLMGGSLAQGLSPTYDICAWDPLQSARDSARDFGLEIVEREDLWQTDFLWIATPPASVLNQVRDALVYGDAWVSDLASIKAPLVAGAGDLEQRSRWLPGHPMAGKQNSGWNNADPDIFQNATWALASDWDPDLEGLLLMSEMISCFQAGILPTYPERHDSACAASSTMIQLLHSSLGSRLADDAPLLHRLSGPAMRDTTRLAESPYEGMWEDILRAGPQEAERALSDFISELEQTRDQLARRDFAGIRQTFRHGWLGRDRLLEQRWRDPLWRSASVPEQNWWRDLCALGEDGVLTRSFSRESGILFFERTR